MNLFLATFLSILIGIFCITPIQSENINFSKKKFDEVMKESKNKKKAVLLDFYADWCPPCKEMDETVLSKKEVFSYFNQNFISKKIDGDSEFGKKLMKKYGVISFPTYIFISPDQKRTERVSGLLNVNQFMYYGKITLDPSQSLDSLRRVFIEDPDNRDKMLALLNILEKDDVSEIGGILDYHYFRKKKINLKTLWKDVHKYSPLNSTRVVQTVRKNKTKLVSFFNEKDLDSHLQNIALTSLIFALKNIDENAFLEAKNDYGAINTRDEKLSLDILELDFYGRFDLNKFRNYAKQLSNSDYKNDWEVLMVIAEQFVEKSNKPEDLSSALDYINRSISLEENANNLDTKAIILKNMNRTEEAIQIAKKVKTLKNMNREKYEEQYFRSLELLNN
jgi:thiol-disulfide isomerase/thioredoxin